MTDEARDVLERTLRFIEECEQEQDRLLNVNDDFSQMVGYKAVAMDLTQIGESVNKMRKNYPEILSRRPEIPWDQIVGLRNIIVHSYDNVLEEEIREALRINLPELRAAVVSLLRVP